jgi:hypothetical protein
MTWREIPLAGQPGQPGRGRTASLRRQPARVIERRVEGGYTDAFELVCCECVACDCQDHADNANA